MSSRETYGEQLSLLDMLADDPAAADPIPAAVDLTDLPAMDERFTLDIWRVGAGRQLWDTFRPHHYLTGKYSGIRAWLATTPDGEPVAFTSVMAFPHGRIKRGFREHRIVVLPDFQGLGIGARLSDWLGEYMIANGNRFFSKTSHPRFGAYREASPNWRATSSNRKVPTLESTKGQAAEGVVSWQADVNRLCWSHEYVGSPDRVVEWL